MATARPLSGMIIDEAVFAPLMGLVIGSGSARITLEYVGQPELVIRWLPPCSWKQLDRVEPLAPNQG